MDARIRGEKGKEKRKANWRSFAERLRRGGEEGRKRLWIKERFFSSRREREKARGRACYDQDGRGERGEKSKKCPPGDC